MLKLKVILYNLINAQKESKSRKVILFPLCLLSFFYGLASSTRVFLYSRGIFKSHSLPCKVVSVGNITLGGTGKTPFVSLLAETIKARGYRVAILSRGYKGNFPGPVGVVSDGNKILMEPQQAGDEPFLLAEKVKDVPVVVGRERWLSGQFALKRFQSEVIILDDGYQHLSLKRDLNLLLIDSSSPFGNGHLFPRGVLREPLGQVSRADAVILTKTGQSDNINKLKMNLERTIGERATFQVDYAPEGVRVYGTEKFLPPGYLNGKKVLAFSGVAKPESFRKTLNKLNADIAALLTFPDHHWYRSQDGEELWQKAAALGVEALITTEKDLIRVKNLIPGHIPLWALAIRHVFPQEDQARFFEFVFSRLGLKAREGLSGRA